MDSIRVQLETAEFEAVWLQVRFHEGLATMADVEEAIDRVNELRRLARDVARHGRAGAAFTWIEPRALATIGN